RARAGGGGMLVLFGGWAVCAGCGVCPPPRWGGGLGVGLGVGARQYVHTGRAASLGQTRSLSRATPTSTRPRDAFRADASRAETLVAPAPPASHPRHTFPSPSSNWPLHRRLCLSRAAHRSRGRWWSAWNEISRR